MYEQFHLGTSPSGVTNTIQVYDMQITVITWNSYYKYKNTICTTNLLEIWNFADNKD